PAPTHRWARKPVRASRRARRSDRLRVLTVVDSLQAAGAETVATWIALGLDRTRFDSLLCSTRASPPEIVEAVRKRGIEVLELQRSPPAKVASIPNGVPDLPPGNRDRVRRALRVSRAAPLVGTVCGLRPEKDLETALRALARVNERHPKLRFVVAGDGPERA